MQRRPSHAGSNLDPDPELRIPSPECLIPGVLHGIQLVDARGQWYGQGHEPLPNVWELVSARPRIRLTDEIVD